MKQENGTLIQLTANIDVKHAPCGGIPPRSRSSENAFQTAFSPTKLTKGSNMKKIRKPVKQIVIGTYQSMKAASKQVDLLMRGNGDLCVNIVQDGRKYQVRTVVWQ